MRYVQIYNPDTGKHELVPKSEHVSDAREAHFNITRVPDHVTDNITGDPVRITSWKKHDQLCKEAGVTPKFGKGWV